MTEKCKKGLFLPDWGVALLDAEGKLYDGPGTVASAAITASCTMDKTGKISALKRFREVEIKADYLDIDGKDIKAVRALLDETKASRDGQARTGRQQKRKGTGAC